MRTTDIIQLKEIKEIISTLDVLPAIESGFVAYSNKKAVVPPVGEMLFQNPPGEVHIKYGYLLDDNYYLIKIASGFYENPKLNLSSSNGLLLLFSQKTGELSSILLDEGYLTDLRTAIAGAVAAKYLAPKNIECIGIIGTGIQARAQLLQLKGVTSCRKVMVAGRNQKRLDECKDEMEHEGFSITTTMNMRDIPLSCNLIVTTTPSTSPLIFAQDVQQGTHITAMGADTASKQELESLILQKADLVVADSIAQCRERGEISHALQEGLIQEEKISEIGNVIAGKVPGRVDDKQISVADLTGVAVQDIQIAKTVYEHYLQINNRIE